MCLPEHTGREEAPFEKLPAGNGEAVELASFADHRNDTGALGTNLDNDKAVPERPDNGEPEPVGNYQPCGGQPEQPPDEAG